MYIRFQTAEIDVEGSTKPLGVFQKAYKLRDGQVHDYHKDMLRELLKWFDTHLDEPEKFSRKRTSSYSTRGISRYKDSAKEYIQKMYELKVIFEEYDIFVEVVMTENPGYIVYEDDIQIVAEPYK